MQFLRNVFVFLYDILVFIHKVFLHLSDNYYDIQLACAKP